MLEEQGQIGDRPHFLAAISQQDCCKLWSVLYYHYYRTFFIERLIE
jgi:hypothetical protein